MKTYRKIGLNYPNDFGSEKNSLDFEIRSILNYYHNENLDYDEIKKYLKIWIKYEEFKNYDFPNYIYPDFLKNESDYDEYFNEIIDKDSDSETFERILEENEFSKERFEELDDLIEYSSKNSEILDNFFEDELDKIVKKFDLELDCKIDYGFSYFIEKSRYEEFQNYDFPSYIDPDFLEDEPDYDENFNEIKEI